MATKKPEFTPSPDQIKAIELFKARYTPAVCKTRKYNNWKEALHTAWHNGWDDQMEMGHCLRQIRNTAGGHEWLESLPLYTQENFIAELTAQYTELFKMVEYAIAAKNYTPEALALKMTTGLIAGTANKDGEGIKRTCKHFGIPYTYKAITEFLRN